MLPGGLGAAGRFGIAGAPATPGDFGTLGTPGGGGIPGAPLIPAALKSSSVAPQLLQVAAVGGFFEPHFGQVMSASIVTGLKHINSPSHIWLKEPS